MTRIISKLQRQTALATGALMLIGTTSFADQQFLDDIIVAGSACIGIDCNNGESFGFDTIRMKENNLRIRAIDTSATSSFPSVDWQLTFNDSGNGGLNKFSIETLDNAKVPLTILYGAPSDSLVVATNGFIGFGTSSPSVNTHVKTGNTPTLRLEQDGTSGFSSQAWDLGGNESNFFIRDVSNSSVLPFRIEPSAPTSSVHIDDAGNIGLGTNAPTKELHVRRTASNDAVEAQFESTNNGAIQIRMISTRSTNRRIVALQADGFPESQLNFGNNEFVFFDGSGNEMATLDTTGLLVNGAGITVNSMAMNVPDYVFGPDYDLRPLADVQAYIDQNSHLPEVPSAAEINAGTLNMTDMQMTLLKKVEELTLYTLAQDSQIKALQAKLDTLSD